MIYTGDTTHIQSERQACEERRADSNEIKKRETCPTFKSVHKHLRAMDASGGYSQAKTAVCYSIARA